MTLVSTPSCRSAPSRCRDELLRSAAPHRGPDRGRHHRGPGRGRCRGAAWGRCRGAGRALPGVGRI